MVHDVAQTDRGILLFESAEEDSWHREEMQELCSTAQVEVLAEFNSRTRRRPGQAFISSDRMEELHQHVLELGAIVVVVGADLSPSNHAEIQDGVGARVVDRTQLILDIFAQRAHTREGKLQVELAQLNYLLPRLMGSGADMSRLGGGVGTRGPGETKLESDRRRLRKRISSLSSEIDEVRRQREVSRGARKDLPFPAAALVGYTSAGKSTLLNTLSGSAVHADAKLFSTLDPTTRRVVLPDGWSVLVTDTVGFIRDLPHTLIAAFRATLEEVDEADILIHVIDATHPNVPEQIQAVRETLAEIGVHEKPTVMVYNKADRVKDQYDLRRLIADDPWACYISALKREGISHLIAKIEKAVSSLLTHVEAVVPYDRSDLVSACYEHGHVEKVDYREDAIYVTANVSRSYARSLQPFLADAGQEGAE